MAEMAALEEAALAGDGDAVRACLAKAPDIVRDADPESAGSKLVFRVVKAAEDSSFSTALSGFLSDVLSQAGINMSQGDDDISSSSALEVVAALLAAGAGANASDTFGSSLHSACEKDSDNMALQFAALLVSNGATIDAPTSWGTPLSSCAKKGNVRTAQYLLGHGASVNGTEDANTFGTPLCGAASEGQYECVKLLIDHGADVNITGTFRSALAAAAENGHRDVMELLLANGAEWSTAPKRRGSHSLYYAAYGGHLEIVRWLVEEHGADVTLNSESGTALHGACEKGHVPIVEYVLSLVPEGAARTAYINTISASDCSFDKTAICSAAAGKHLEVIKLLLAHGADPNISGHRGAALLHLKYGEDWNGPKELSFDCFLALLEAGADPTGTNPWNSVASRIVEASPSEEAAIRMLEHLSSQCGARLDQENKWHQTALHVAVKERKYMTAQCLVRLGHRVDTAFHAPCPTDLQLLLSKARLPVEEEEQVAAVADTLRIILENGGNPLATCDEMEESPVQIVENWSSHSDESALTAELRSQCQALLARSCVPFQEQLDRLERERLEQERLENERLQKERVEKERLQQERLEQERKEEQRKAAERQASSARNRALLVGVGAAGIVAWCAYSLLF